LPHRPRTRALAALSMGAACCTEREPLDDGALPKVLLRENCFDTPELKVTAVGEGYVTILKRDFASGDIIVQELPLALVVASRDPPWLASMRRELEMSSPGHAWQYCLAAHCLAPADLPRFKPLGLRALSDEDAAKVMELHADDAGSRHVSVAAVVAARHILHAALVMGAGQAGFSSFEGEREDHLARRLDAIATRISRNGFQVKDASTHPPTEVDALFHRAAYVNYCEAGLHTATWEFHASRKVLTVKAVRAIRAGDELTFDAASKPWLGRTGAVQTQQQARSCGCRACVRERLAHGGPRLSPLPGSADPTLQDRFAAECGDGQPGSGEQQTVRLYSTRTQRKGMDCIGEDTLAGGTIPESRADCAEDAAEACAAQEDKDMRLCRLRSKLKKWGAEYMADDPCETDAAAAASSVPFHGDAELELHFCRLRSKLKRWGAEYMEAPADDAARRKAKPPAATAAKAPAKDDMVAADEDSEQRICKLQSKLKRWGASYIGEASGDAGLGSATPEFRQPTASEAPCEEDPPGADGGVDSMKLQGSCGAEVAAAGDMDDMACGTTEAQDDSPSADEGADASLRKLPSNCDVEDTGKAYVVDASGGTDEAPRQDDPHAIKLQSSGGADDAAEGDVGDTACGSASEPLSSEDGTEEVGELGASCGLRLTQELDTEVDRAEAEPSPRKMDLVLRECEPERVEEKKAPELAEKPTSPCSAAPVAGSLVTMKDDTRTARLLQRCRTERLAVSDEIAERVLRESGGNVGKAMTILRQSA